MQIAQIPPPIDVDFGQARPPLEPSIPWDVVGFVVGGIIVAVLLFALFAFFENWWNFMWRVRYPRTWRQVVQRREEAFKKDREDREARGLPVADNFLDAMAHSQEAWERIQTQQGEAEFEAEASRTKGIEVGKPEIDDSGTVSIAVTFDDTSFISWELRGYRSDEGFSDSAEDEPTNGLRIFDERITSQTEVITDSAVRPGKTYYYTVLARRKPPAMKRDQFGQTHEIYVLGRKSIAVPIKQRAQAQASQAQSSRATTKAEADAVKIAEARMRFKERVASGALTEEEAEVLFEQAKKEILGTDSDPHFPDWKR